MNTDITLFLAHEPKSTTLTLRLTPRQKSCISDLASQEQSTAARYILDLVGKDYEHKNNICNPIKHGSVESVIATHAKTTEEQSKRAMREINKKYQPCT